MACGLSLVPGLILAQTPPPTPVDYQPMTQRERLRHYFSGTFSLEAAVRSAAGAGILQAMNTPAEWGQGAEGYGERFASSYAQHILRQTLVYGASDLLHEDNRYFRMGKGSPGTRFKYAVASTFLARKEDGTRRFSYSRAGAFLAVAFISREWQPHSTSDLQSAGMSFATVMGSEVGFNVAREFIPKLFFHHNDQTTAKPESH
jgi:hypothetical protein